MTENFHSSLLLVYDSGCEDGALYPVDDQELRYCERMCLRHSLSSLDRADENMLRDS